jgi:hypothetical protein
MEFEYEKSLAVRLLTGLEKGDLPLSDVYRLAEKCPAVTVYFVVRFLREKYSANPAAGAGVLTRIAELGKTYVDVAKMMKEGESDSLREWFDDAFEMRQFYTKPDEFVHMIVEKVEG